MLDPRELEIGQRVFWTDPANETSGEYTIRLTGLEDIDTSEYEEDDYQDVIVFCTNDAGGELECFAHELSSVAKTNLVLFPKKPDLPNGTQLAERLVYPTYE